MKRIHNNYPLLGYDFDEIDNFDEIYNLATEFVNIIVSNKKSYAEACEAFNIAKKGLETLRLDVSL